MREGEGGYLCSTVSEIHTHLRFPGYSFTHFHRTEFFWFSVLFGLARGGVGKGYDIAIKGKTVGRTVNVMKKMVYTYIRGEKSSEMGAQTTHHLPYLLSTRDTSAP